MGFQLTIAEGKEAGKEFVFEQASVTIGRTSDCDVILYDPGVSRKHARIFSDGGGYAVEDLGSSNGTKVNGNTVKKQGLASGDAVTLGPVVFHFQLAAPALPPEPGTDAAGDVEQSTRIVTLDALKPKAVAMAPPNADAQELSRMSRTATRSVPSLTSLDEPEGHTVVRPRVSSANVPARPAPASSPRSSVPARAAPAAAPKLTAAERARIKRESGGLSGKAKIFWAEASPGTRRFTTLGLLVLVAGVGFGAYTLLKGEAVKKKVEAQTLGREPVTSSFGLGTDEDPVDFEHRDEKTFRFEFNSPTRAVAILHYQASEIGSNEVSVSLNGQDVGFIPVDTFASHERTNEFLFQPAMLKKGEPNKLTFDNTKNPPGRDTWRIWNLWVETIPLPEVPTVELMRDANEYFQRAQLSEQREMIGAENLFTAWKNYRTAWLMLEVTENKPELYVLARDGVRRTQTKLDKLCSKLLLEVEQSYNHKDYQAAVSTLEHVKEYFPDPRAQTCPARADDKRDELGI